MEKLPAYNPIANTISMLIPIAIYSAIALFVIFRIYRFLRRKTKLRKIATILGFEYRDIAIDRSIDRDLAEIKGPRIRSFLEKFVYLISPWEMKGSINGMRVKIKPRRYLVPHKGLKRLATRIEVELPEKLGLGLKLFSKNYSLNKMEHRFSAHRKKIKTGNENFDEKIKIRGVAEERILILLSRTEVQDALLKLIELEPSAVLDDQFVFTEEKGVITDPKHCRAKVDALATVAQCVHRANRFV